MLIQYEGRVSTIVIKASTLALSENFVEKVFISTGRTKRRLVN